ncbi:MAG: Holliday junction resolvase RuvX [Tissierellia bacterium]|nr:Holliday junction resolvase RuvX [Tissierellia bacterium]
MTIIALDYGDRRIGLAINTEGDFVFARPYIPRKSNSQAIDCIIDFLRREDVDLIVLGAPYNMDDSQGEAMDKVLAFKKALEKKIRYTNRLVKRPEVDLWDERNTTTRAEEILIQQDVSRSRRKEIIDSLAASLLLEDYLKEKGA